MLAAISEAIAAECHSLRIRRAASAFEFKGYTFYPRIMCIQPFTALCQSLLMCINLLNAVFTGIFRYKELMMNTQFNFTNHIQVEALKTISVWLQSLLMSSQQEPRHNAHYPLNPHGTLHQWLAMDEPLHLAKMFQHQRSGYRFLLALKCDTFWGFKCQTCRHDFTEQTPWSHRTMDPDCAPSLYAKPVPHVQGDKTVGCLRLQTSPWLRLPPMWHGD